MPAANRRRAFDRHQRLTFRDSLWFTSIRIRAELLLNRPLTVFPRRTQKRLGEAVVAGIKYRFRTFCPARTVNRSASRGCHSARISYCFLSGFLRLCDAQKSLDIPWRHLKIEPIAAMHKTSRSGQTNLCVSPPPNAVRRDRPQSRSVNHDFADPRAIRCSPESQL
jgi:hypothetical protein